MKTIVFDCDGVVCDLYVFAKKLISEYGITFEMTKDFFINEFPKCAKGLDTVENLLPNYLVSWGWNGSTQDFIDLWLESEKDIRLNIKELIKNLREQGYRVLLATNQESNRAKYLRDYMRLNSLFDELFISCEIGCMKPEEAFYKEIMNKYNDLILIDDDQRNLLPANKLGWDTILYRNPEQLMFDLDLLKNKLLNLF